MDCMRTQEILSLAADRAPIDPDLLQEAKAHCAECAECAEFVRGLARLHRASTPRMAPQALEALVKRARAEAERLEVSQAHAEALAAPTDEAEAEAAALAALAALKTQETTKRPKLNWSGLSEMPMRQQALIGTAVAAAIIVVGIVSVAGMSYLLAPKGTQTASRDMTAQDNVAGSMTAAPEMLDTPASDGIESTRSPSEERVALAYVVYDGWVFRGGSPAAIDLASLTTAGSLRSDLGTGQEQSRPVWSSDDPLMIYVQSDSGELLGFELVTRRLEGVRFGLRSAEITSYGQWPSLPAGIPQPVAEDGSPTFQSTGTDDDGATTYVLAGTTASQGYAIAPFTPTVETSMGNPSWTWWLPVPTE